jgi:hypothetical protein
MPTLAELKLVITDDTQPALAGVGRLDTSIEGLKTNVGSLSGVSEAAWAAVGNVSPPRAAIDGLRGSLTAAKEQLQALTAGEHTLKVDAQIAAAQQKVATLDRDVQKLVDTGVKPIDLDVRVATAQAQAARLAVDLDKLQNPKPIEIKANATQAQGAIEGVVGTLGKLALAYGGLQLLQQGLGAVADAAIGFNAKLEQAQTAFTGLLGRAPAAKDYLQTPTVCQQHPL